jgi:two-component system sensor histidine kinase HydH
MSRCILVATQPYQLLQRFSILSLVIVAIVFGTCSVLLSRFLTEHVVQRDATLTKEFLQSVVDVENETGYRNGDDPDLRDRHFEQFFEHVSRLPDVLRANIYAPDRRIIWSSDRKLELGATGDNPELDQALRGDMHVEIDFAGPKDPKPEHAHLTDEPVRFVEVYVPLKDRRKDRVIGVAELYRVPTELFESIRKGKQLIWTFAVASGLLLYGALFWIVRGADRTIREQRERLAETERFAALGELSAAVAHGIRNPLASIRSSAELCVDDASPAVGEALQDIIGEVDQLERWVHDLLAYSVSAGDGVVSADLHNVVGRAEAAFRRECERHRVTLVSELPPSIPAVMGDEALLEQVLCSLFANAIDAMPEGGALSVAARLTGDGKAVTVTVADTGHGIDPRYASQLFTPHATTKPNGMGLGLSLVRHIVRRFGGDVRIESGPQQGTRVILQLNVAA